VLTLMLPVRQLGVVFPPWQLTFAQVRAVLLNEAAPDCALYVERNAASPGATRSAFIPGRAFARS